jgi:hypothetical protein
VVLYLNDAGRDFDGGTFQFFDDKVRRVSGVSVVRCFDHHQLVRRVADSALAGRAMSRKRSLPSQDAC